ncbi:MAG: glycosyltransferase family 2 protein [Deltaproteobacteria bacterium]|nr:glycosyltransferase family 2 protein [Deltaproteobacteria bacterium]
MADPQITFAIPFYSAPELLRAAIDSVVRQSESAWTLVVVDNKSPHGDAARAIVASYADPRMRYERNDAHVGMAGNWNRCLDAATSDLVTLLHADDELAPDYARTLLSVMDRAPDASLGFCMASTIDRRGRRVRSIAGAYKKRVTPKEEPIRLRGEIGLMALLRGNFITAPALCYRKSRLFDERFLATWKAIPDLDFTTRILFAGGTIVGTHALAYRWRRHAELDHARGLRRFEEEAGLYDALARQAEARGWDRAARIGRKKNVLKLRVAFAAASDLAHRDVASASKKVRFLATRLTALRRILPRALA